MTRQDDELVRRYKEASAQEDARPGTQVRDAVRAHAQMLAAAAAKAPSPTAIVSTRAAANQSRWKLSALATVALVGLTGLLMLQFERGTPEERDIAFGQRRAQAPAPAAAPAPLPTAVPDASEVREAVPDPARDLVSPPPRDTAQKPAPAEPAKVGRSATAIPPTAHAPTQPEVPAAPAPGDSETLTRPGADGALSGFPSSPAPPAPPPAPSSPEAPRTETRERSAMQEKTVSKAMPPPRPALSQTAPSQHDPSPMARSLPSGNAAGDDAAAAAPQVHKALDPALPRALRDAARVGNAREVESLINQGVPVDTRDTAGKTALMIAALNGHTAAVQTLLALGAQTALVDGDGLTAAQHARRWGYGAIAALIDAAR